MRKGSHHTEEARAKMRGPRGAYPTCPDERRGRLRDKLLSFYSTPEGIENRKRKHEKLMGHPPYGNTPVRSRRISLALKGKPGHPQSVRTRRILSEKITLLLSKGRGPYKTFRVNTLKGGPLTLRSSYEVAFARWLDENPRVIRFSYEVVRVSYLWNGQLHRTTIDFLVVCLNETWLVEVKPSWAVKRYQRNRLKLVSAYLFACNYGWKFYWWDGEACNELGRGWWDKIFNYGLKRDLRSNSENLNSR